VGRENVRGKNDLLRAFAAVDCGYEGSTVADGGDEYGRSKGHVVERSEGGFAVAEDGTVDAVGAEDGGGVSGRDCGRAGVGGAGGEVGRGSDTPDRLAQRYCGDPSLRSG